MTPLLHEGELLRNRLAEDHVKLIVLGAIGQAEDGGFSSRETDMNARLLQWCRASGVECVDMLSVFNQHTGDQPVFRIRDDGPGVLWRTDSRQSESCCLSNRLVCKTRGSLYGNLSRLRVDAA